MSYHLHFLRPDWFFALIPWGLLILLCLRQQSASHAWQRVCDPHLLPHLLEHGNQAPRRRAQVYFLSALCLIILSLTGPSGKRLPVPVYHPINPRVVVLDLSDTMLKTDLKPNRLTRAKFKLHDLFQKEDAGQFGLVVYTSEPFVVSPLTRDAHTIDSLIHSLDPSIMPVGGMDLKQALQEGARLIKQTQATQGTLLVLTGSAPSTEAIQTVKNLSHQHIQTSILPLTTSMTNHAAFKAFADAGDGQALRFTHTTNDLDQWLKNSGEEQMSGAQTDDAIPVWRDDGRWLLIPALLCLLPAFRRHWLLRIRP